MKIFIHAVNIYSFYLADDDCKKHEKDIAQWCMFASKDNCEKDVVKTQCPKLCDLCIVDEDMNKTSGRHISIVINTKHKNIKHKLYKVVLIANRL